MCRDARSASGRSARSAPSKTRGTRAGQKRVDAPSAQTREKRRRAKRAGARKHAGRAGARSTQARGSRRYVRWACRRALQPAVRSGLSLLVRAQEFAGRGRGGFPLGSLVRTPRADGTRPQVRLRLKKSAARPAGSRPRADAIRRAAERSRRAAERSCRTERPPQPRSLCGLRLELLADGRLQSFQRARSRRPRAPTRGICRRVTGVSVHRPAASRPAGSRTSFCISPSLINTASKSPLLSSTLNVRVSAVFFRKYTKIVYTPIKIPGHALHERGLQR